MKNFNQGRSTLGNSIGNSTGNSILRLKPGGGTGGWGNRSCGFCEMDYTHLGAECCDSACETNGVTCTTLENEFGWNCSGCVCPCDSDLDWGDCVDTDNGATDSLGFTCAMNGTVCYDGAYDDDDFNEMEMCCACGGGVAVEDFSCPAGTVPDCVQFMVCCPESWIGDGFPDCVDQQYGCDLSCYDDDGYDCCPDGTSPCPDGWNGNISQCWPVEECGGGGGSDCPEGYDECGVCGGDGSSCAVYGCTNFMADNYNPDATIDDGSCEYLGCTDPNADNYSPFANTDDGSCTYPLIGDVNQDGIINVVDIIAMVNCILSPGGLGSEQACAAVDVNQDGINNVVDIIWLVNMILSRGISSSDQQQINGALQRLINSNIPTQVERQQLQNQMNKLGRIQRGRGRRR